MFGDFFGGSVAIAGDTIVVGAPNEDSNATGVDGNQANNSVPNAGAAYVFVREGTSWSQQAYLKASNTTPGDFRPQFGSAVTISESEDTLAIGAPFEASNGSGVNGTQNIFTLRGSGAAYVFDRSGATWSQRAYLKASNPGPGNMFGSVAVSGDTLIVGAYEEDSSTTGVNSIPNNNPQGSNYGAAYVFTGLAPLPPPLTILSSDNAIRLSWPLTATDWVLEHSETMEEAAAWLPIPPPYGSDAADFFHTVPNPAGRGFFRLHKP